MPESAKLGGIEPGYVVGVPLPHPDLPGLLTASTVGRGWDRLGESREVGLPGECQFASCVFQRFNNSYDRRKSLAPVATSRRWDGTRAQHTGFSEHLLLFREGV